MGSFSAIATQKAEDSALYMWKSGANDEYKGRKLLKPGIKSSLGSASSTEVKSNLSKGTMSYAVVLARKEKKGDGDIETIQLLSLVKAFRLLLRCSTFLLVFRFLDKLYYLVTRQIHVCRFVPMDRV